MIENSQVTQKGGYNIEAVSNSVVACVKVLLDDPLPRIHLKMDISSDCFDVVKRVTQIHSKYWDCFRRYACNEWFVGCESESDEILSESSVEMDG